MTRRALTLIALPALIAAPAVAHGKSFKDTKEYRTEQKGYLNVKFDTYASMKEEPKGTDCDWGYVAPGFDLADVRKAGLTLTVASFAAHEDGGYFFGFYQNPIVDSFRQSLGTLGIAVQMGAGSQSQAGTVMSAELNATAAIRARGDQAGQNAMATYYAQNPQMVEVMVNQEMQQDAVGNQIEKDKYEEDKKTMSVDEAATRAAARQEARKAKLRDQILGKNAAPAAAPVAAEAAKPTNPEDRPGYQLIFYVTESKNQDSVWSPVATNSTTGEFILLKDGKPVLAARHNSASIGFGSGSGAKCGVALASAFNIVQPR